MRQLDFEVKVFDDLTFRDLVSLIFSRKFIWITNSSFVSVIQMPFEKRIRSVRYCGDPNIRHSNTRNIRKLSILVSGFQMVWFTNGQAKAFIPTIWKPLKMAANLNSQVFKWSFFKWLGYSPHHLKPNIQMASICLVSIGYSNGIKKPDLMASQQLSTIQNPD